MVKCSTLSRKLYYPLNENQLTDTYSRAWQGWRGRIEDKPEKSQRQTFVSRTKPYAMAGLMSGLNATDLPMEPLSLQIVNILWNVFSQRVEPFVRIMFRGAKSELRAKSTNLELQSSMTAAEQALATTICYASVNSLSDDDCQAMLQIRRSSLLDECQARSEDTLLRTNLFCMADLNTIRAIVFYIVRCLSLC
jgi:hypothetical protein